MWNIHLLNMNSYNNNSLKANPSVWKCHCLVSILCRTNFELLTPKVQRRHQKVEEKSVFRPLNGKISFQNFAMKGFIGTRIYVFLSGLAEIGI